MVLSEAEAEARLAALRREREALDRAIADLSLYLELGRRLNGAGSDPGGASGTESGAGPLERKALLRGLGPAADDRAGTADREADRADTPGGTVEEAAPGAAPMSYDRHRSDRSSHPRPHPEVRGEAEPRRSPPEGTALPGRSFEAADVAPQDEGQDRRTESERIPRQVDAARSVAAEGEGEPAGGLSEGVLARRHGRALIEAALAALEEAGRPLHASEILAVLDARGFALPGRDPVAALNTRLWKRAGPGGPLRRLGDAVYALAEEAED